jgi:hypothetical protein
MSSEFLHFLRRKCSLLFFSGTCVHWAGVGNGIGDQGVRFPAGAGIFLYSTASRPALGPTQPSIKRVPEAFSLRVKWPGREADRSPPSSAEVKNAWSYTSTPPYVLKVW